jgi:hypothetical protein
MDCQAIHRASRGITVALLTVIAHAPSSTAAGPPQAPAQPAASTTYPHYSRVSQRRRAQRSLIHQSIHRLGRRRPRRHLAHGRRRRNLAPTTVPGFLLTELRLLRRRPSRLGGRRQMPTLQRRHPRRCPPHRRRRHHLAATAPTAPAIAIRRKILRPRPRHRLRPIRVVHSFGCLLDARRR